MSIPTHNLYDFIYSTIKSQMLMRYFYPFGEKRLEKCIPKHKLDAEHKDLEALYKDNMFFSKNLPGTVIDYIPMVICHDQEPLNFDLYSEHNTTSYVQIYKDRKGVDRDIKNLNLRMIRPMDYHKKLILLHSDINGDELKKYMDTGDYEPAYCWTNALLSVDWYRFAEHDSELLPASNVVKDFLVYCRSEDGLRTYRTDFKNIVRENNLFDVCQWSSFENVTNASSDLSAVYSSIDINQTLLSVVLETVYDLRIHLTEKTLRPIACGHPFILVSGPGSLEHLKSYGFKTFHPYINESYDSESDPGKRMNMVVQEMKKISNLSKSEKQKLLQNLLSITEHNKKLFFSKNFTKTLMNQLTSNMQTAYEKTVYNLCWKKIWNGYKDIKKYRPHLLDYNNRILHLTLIKHLKKGGTLDDYVPPDLD